MFLARSALRVVSVGEADHKLSPSVSIVIKKAGLLDLVGDVFMFIRERGNTSRASVSRRALCHVVFDAN